VILAIVVVRMWMTHRELTMALASAVAIVKQQADEANRFGSRLDAAYKELESSSAQLKEMAFKDHGTGLYNRRFLLLRLTEEVERWSRFSHPVSIVLLDVDGLRIVSETTSYAAYDDALTAFAQILVAALHGGGLNVPARYDGSRFAVLLVETQRQDALRFVDRVREAVAKSPHSGETRLKIGIASLPEDAVLAQELLSVADTSLRRGSPQ
jgi:diguanylate cyclase (GGDEF)-like protein